MILSKATGYGIRALAHLAHREPGHPCGLRELAEALRIPPVYLCKILRELRRHRLVQTTKGIHGGYALARAPEEITLWDVFQLLEPDPDLDGCILGRGLCQPDSPCILHSDWERLRDGFVSFLQQRTISDLSQSKPVPLAENFEERAQHNTRTDMVLSENHH
ncbi:MAG: Rrf2 family transcriptional regulator [Acidobacteria bacterium]|nr:Rrf2 family transcriptional regulator [Acidobacteriota bacterium]